MSSLMVRIPIDTKGNFEMSPESWVNKALSDRPSELAHKTFQSLDVFSKAIEQRLTVIYPSEYNKTEGSSKVFLEEPLAYVKDFLLSLVEKINNLWLSFIHYKEISFLDRAYLYTSKQIAEFQWIKTFEKQEVDEFLETSGEPTRNQEKRQILLENLTPYNKYVTFCKQQLRNHEIVKNTTPVQKKCIEAFMKSSLDTKLIVFLLNKIFLPNLEQFEIENNKFFLRYSKNSEEQLTAVGGNPLPEIPLLTWCLKKRIVEGALTTEGIENLVGISFEIRDNDKSWGTWLFGKSYPDVKIMQNIFSEQIEVAHNGTVKVWNYSFVQLRDLLLFTRI